MGTITIFTDGGARGNPGPAGAGALILNERGETAREISDYLGHTTNNIAEYEALIRALEAAHALLQERFLETRIEINMDSELIVRQMQGLYKVKASELKPRFMRVQNLIAGAKYVSFTHIRREHNTRADALVNAAIDHGLGLR